MRVGCRGSTGTMDHYLDVRLERPVSRFTNGLSWLIGPNFGDATAVCVLSTVRSRALRACATRMARSGVNRPSWARVIRARRHPSGEARMAPAWMMPTYSSNTC